MHFAFSTDLPIFAEHAQWCRSYDNRQLKREKNEIHDSLSVMGDRPSKRCQHVYFRCRLLLGQGFHRSVDPSTNPPTQSPSLILQWLINFHPHVSFTQQASSGCKYKCKYLFLFFSKVTLFALEWGWWWCSWVSSWRWQLLEWFALAFISILYYLSLFLHFSFSPLLLVWCPINTVSCSLAGASFSVYLSTCFTSWLLDLHVHLVVPPVRWGSGHCQAT